MQKFGLFTLSHGPYQTWEADYIDMDKEYVKVYKFGEETGRNELVAAVRLDKGQSVKKLDQ